MADTQVTNPNPNTETLILKNASGQASDTMQVLDNSDAIIFSIDPNGAIMTAGQNVATQNYVATVIDNLGTAAALDFDTDGTLAANSDTVLATQKAVKTYVGNSVTGLLDFKGSTDASGNPNYPVALKGDSYVVSVAGKIGGASGKSVSIGDAYIATADNAGGSEASVGTSWDVLIHSLTGACLTANNLSDVNATSAKSNLGIGTISSLSAPTGTGFVKVSSGAITTTDTNTYLTTAVTSLTGTANQVTASASTGAVTLSLPQSIATSSSPQFASVTATTSLFNSSGANSFLTQPTLVTQTVTGIGGTLVNNKSVQLYNTTSAANNSQQVSPSLCWKGNGWKTASTAGSNSVEFMAGVLPIQGSSAPTGVWKLQSNIAGAGFSDCLSVFSGGAVTVTGGLTASTTLGVTGDSTFGGVLHIGSQSAGSDYFLTVDQSINSVDDMLTFKDPSSVPMLGIHTDGTHTFIETGDSALQLTMGSVVFNGSIFDSDYSLSIDVAGRTLTNGSNVLSWLDGLEVFSDSVFDGNLQVAGGDIAFNSNGTSVLGAGVITVDGSARLSNSQGSNNWSIDDDGLGKFDSLELGSLPTSDPHVAGKVWDSSGTLKVSHG